MSLRLHALTAVTGLALAGLGAWLWQRFGMEVWLDALIAFCA